MIEMLTTEEVSKRLHKSPRWLQDFLRRNPWGRDGRPFFRLAGRTKLFTDADILRILEALPCPSNSFPRARVRRRSGTYEAPTSDNLWIEAQRLTGKPLHGNS